MPFLFSFRLSVCPSAAVLTDVSGEITSPFYPRKYPTAQNCLWKIQANKDKRLKLEVIDMEIERCGQSGACTCDYLEVQNAYKSGDGAASGKTCVDENFKPVTYYSTNNAINVQFSSDLPGGRRHKGFKAIYTVLSNTPLGKRAKITSLICNNLNLFVITGYCNLLIIHKP